MPETPDAERLLGRVREHFTCCLGKPEVAVSHPCVSCEETGMRLASIALLPLLEAVVAQERLVRHSKECEACWSGLDCREFEVRRNLVRHSRPAAIRAVAVALPEEKQ